MSRSAMRRRVRSGRWVQLDRGIVALAGSPPSWERGILALCLSKNGVASHLSAACLHGLSPLPGCSTFEVTVARGRSTRSDLGRVHAMGDAQLVDRVWIGPVPATGLARTLLDVGSAVGYSRHARIVDDALDRRLIDHRDLAECPDRHRGLRRRGIVRLTRLLAERGSGRVVTESTFERRFVQFCAERGLEIPHTRFLVSDAGQVVARCDGAFPAAGLVVELDGRRGHSQLTDRASDSLRDQKLLVPGWSTMRVTWRQLTSDPDVLERRLRKLLGSRP